MRFYNLMLFRNPATENLPQTAPSPISIHTATLRYPSHQSVDASPHLPPLCRYTSVSTTKLARTWGINSFIFYTISSCKLPAAAITAASTTSKPLPVDRFFESITVTLSFAPSSSFPYLSCHRPFCLIYVFTAALRIDKITSFYE